MQLVVELQVMQEHPKLLRKREVVAHTNLNSKVLVPYVLG
jgi:hypothetical protein